MPKEIFLDIGCGQGGSTIDYGKVPGFLVGVDRDPCTLKNNHHAINGRLLPVCADARALPFAKASIDSVFATHILEHLPRGGEKVALGEIKRTLVPGGKATFAVPHPRFERVIGRLIPEYHSSDMHQQIFSPSRFASVIEEAGLGLSRIKTQKWPVALCLIGQALRHKYFPEKVKFKSQLGFEMTREGRFSRKLIAVTKRINNLIARIPLINDTFNGLFPFETYTEAVNPK